MVNRLLILLRFIREIAMISISKSTIESMDETRVKHIQYMTRILRDLNIINVEIENAVDEIATSISHINDYMVNYCKHLWKHGND